MTVNEDETPIDALRRHYPGWREKDYQAAENSNLVTHALHELSLMKYNDDVTDEYEYMIACAVLDIVAMFAGQGHSGMSGSIALRLLEPLLDFKPLGVLTDDPTEWHEVYPGTWQNRRDGEAFSLNGGKTYYLLIEMSQWRKKLIRLVPTWLGGRKLRLDTTWTKFVYPFHTSAKVTELEVAGIN